MNGLVLTSRMVALADRARHMPPRVLAMFWVQALVLPLLRSVAPEEALARAERSVDAHLVQYTQATAPPSARN